jgi:hypothetical protein
MGAGNAAVAGQVGVPGISATLLEGIADQLDLGARVGFNYFFEDMVGSNVPREGTSTVPGLRLQGVARINLIDQARLGLGLEFAPGPIFYFRPAGTRYGLAIPVDLRAGIPVGSAILVNAGIDVNMFADFTDHYFAVPLLFGGGAEYFIDRDLAATFNLKMGPVLRSNGFDTEFGLEALVGIAYKF